MLAWLRRRLSSKGHVSAPVPLETVDRTDEVLEAIARLGRAAAKQSAGVEARLEALEAGVRSAEERSQGANLPSEALDALDALDQAIERSSQPAMAEGLAGIREKMERHLGELGYRRLGRRGERPDPKIMKVVAVEADPEVGSGRIARVVRTAVLSGTVLLREGHVIVSAKGRDDEQHVGD